VADKILFASGFPFEHPIKTIEAIYSLHAFSHGTQLPAVPRSVLRAIVERDPIGELSIDAPGFVGASRRTESTVDADGGRLRP